MDCSLSMESVVCTGSRLRHQLPTIDEGASRQRRRQQECRSPTEAAHDALHVPMTTRIPLYKEDQRRYNKKAGEVSEWQHDLLVSQNGSLASRVVRWYHVALAMRGFVARGDEME